MSDTDKMAALIQLAGAIAHELNNIFTAVTGNLSLIEESPTNAETIGEVVRTAQRGIALSEKLQAFAGRQPLKRRHVDIAPLLAGIARDIAAALPASVRFEARLLEGACVCYVDERKLADCIKELAANAVTAMRGKGILKLEALTESFAPGERRGLRSGSYAVLRVSDTGAGMGPEVAARALDPMFSTRGSSVNFGWGLSSCAGFLRQSGGALGISSQPGRGTIVEALLPADLMASRHVA